jgi:hypothetical protein
MSGSFELRHATESIIFNGNDNCLSCFVTIMLRTIFLPWLNDVFCAVLFNLKEMFNNQKELFIRRLTINRMICKDTLGCSFKNISL